MVWQDLALCDNLDIAANIMLGQEPKRLMLSDTRLHAAAAEVLNELRIPLKDTTRSVRSLSGGQRQLVAVARAMGSSRGCWPWTSPPRRSASRNRPRSKS